jgi:phosphoribosylamine---glycine ligase
VRVLLVGSGGREHALAWKLAASPRLSALHAAPGNPGSAAHAELHDVDTADAEGLTALAGELAADLVVVGPEAPLVAGLADRMAEAGIACFGPTAAAAAIEGSKAFAKSVMDAAGVPTARFTVCDTVAAADAAIAEAGGEVVVKADGLAAGKGVTVCSGAAEAQAAVRECLVGDRFGSAGARVVIEERLEGEEVSLLALCDGEDAVALAPARDHKRALDGDRGPNTGGMGCISPVPGVDDALVDDIVSTVHRPVLAELRRRGAPFRGCLYAGLMLTAAGPKVIEFNARFGDPEAQAVLPRTGGDLLDLLARAATGTLAGAEAGTTAEACVSVVVASRGYPESAEVGVPITGITDAEAVPGVTVFQAGTAMRDGALVTTGGRVLAVTAAAPTFADARERAYAAVGRIRIDGAHHRTDIGITNAGREHVHV